MAAGRQKARNLGEDGIGIGDVFEDRLAVHQINRIGGNAGIGEIALAQVEIVRRVREGDLVDADQAPGTATEMRQCRRAPAATGVEHSGIRRQQRLNAVAQDRIGVLVTAEIAMFETLRQ